MLSLARVVNVDQQSLRLAIRDPILLSIFRMDQQHDADYNPYSIPSFKDSDPFSLEVNPHKFSGIFPSRSLHTPTSASSIFAYKTHKHIDDLFKNSTEPKETVKSFIYNPEYPHSKDSPTAHKNPTHPYLDAIPSPHKRKSLESDQPRLEFKTKDRSTKRAEQLKMDSINNALEVYMEKRQKKRATLKDYIKNCGELAETTATMQEEPSSSHELVQDLSKAFNFKRVPVEEPQQQPRTRHRAFTTQMPMRPPCLNDFVIGKRLGKGKFGEVFLAKHKKLGMIVAMKVISKEVIKSNNLDNQLSREIMLQMYLNHSHIVSLYGIFSENNNIHLILEPCLDGHLLSELKRKRRLQEEEAAAIIREVLEGVDTMHRASIIHRDLKPENIVRHEGVCKISDFGWAVHSPDSLRETFCGTPLYMSPQLLVGKQYTESVDLWAVGMLAYQLLVGRLPFKVQKSEQLTRIITDEIEFPQFVEVSESAKGFVLSILKKNPQERCDMESIFSHPFLNKMRES